MLRLCTKIQYLGITIIVVVLKIYTHIAFGLKLANLRNDVIWIEFESTYNLALRIGNEVLKIKSSIQ